MVITGLTRNQFDGNVTWVRIPSSPPKRLKSLRLQPFIYFSNYGGLIIMRSQTSYPTTVGLEIFETIKVFWKKGIFDDYSEKHFIIRAINNDVSYFKELFLRKT